MTDRLIYYHDFTQGKDYPLLMHDNGDGTWSIPGWVNGGSGTTDAVMEAIDDRVSDGHLALEGSIGYQIAEIYRHDHTWDRRYGLAVSPSGEVHRADGIGVGVLPFVMTSGNNNWGNWVQLMGSGDSVEGFDLHDFLVSASQSNSAVYFIQVAFGASAAVALAAGTYSELVFIPPGSANGKPSSIELTAEDMPAGAKVWCRVMSVATNAQTLSAYIGLHLHGS